MSRARSLSVPDSGPRSPAARQDDVEIVTKLIAYAPWFSNGLLPRRRFMRS